MYPNQPKLRERIDALGISASDGMIDDALASAIAAWESSTGWRPFVAQGVSVKTITHTGGSVLVLPAGLALRSITSIQVTGSTDAIPAEKLILGLPTKQGAYRSIQGLGTYWGYGSMIVTGVWGLVETCPADVSSAILGLAVARLKGDSGTKGAVVREKVGDVEVQYASSVTTDPVKLALDEFEAVVNRYRVWSI